MRPCFRVAPYQGAQNVFVNLYYIIMKGKIVLLVLVATFMLTSCYTKQSAISQLENYSYELRDHAQYYDARDWQNAIDDFKTIRKRIAKHERDYTPEEKRYIGELEGQCAKYMATGAKQRLVNGVRNIGNELKGIIEGIRGAFSF